MSALELTVGWVAAAVAGRIVSGDPEQVIGNIVTDSRGLQTGDFFIALRGARYDGHAFAHDALGAGAIGVLVETNWAGRAGAVAIIEVGDTTVALQDLAHAVREATETKVVAITGSAGKTTTKDTIAEFLSVSYRVVKNKGNLNNHIGLPLSLLQLRDKPDVAVMELGMNHPGEISTLVAIADPDVRARHAGVDGGIGQRTRRRPTDGEERRQACRRCGAPAVAMLLLRVRAELEHLAEHGHLARGAAVAGDHLERAPQRRRARVVGIVHQRDAAAKSLHGAPAIRCTQPRGTRGDRVERDAELDGDGGCREHVG